MKTRTKEESEAFIAKNLKLVESPTWFFVLEFAERMEARLEKNRHKGDRIGWLKDHPWNLVERMLDETVELQQHFVQSEQGIKYNDAEGLADECADVANFCMMIADSVTENIRANKNGCDLKAVPFLQGGKHLDGCPAIDGKPVCTCGTGRSG